MHFMNTIYMESTAFVLKKDILHNSEQYNSVALAISLYPQHSVQQNKM